MVQSPHFAKTPPKYPFVGKFPTNDSVRISPGTASDWQLFVTESRFTDGKDNKPGQQQGPRKRPE